MNSPSNIGVKEHGNNNGTITGEWTNPFPGSSLDKSSFSGGQLFGTNPGGEFRRTASMMD